ncbi:NAD(P)/FAD-dependent oxidoreductase [Mycobacterium sp.]|uniref:flavin-containing monooxygenase n=1 Tax=Mycobacterium sp. TaxID=1785 RepID=UPI002C896A35|nr:NAD(P)/FAD-dependent oxidoreductase [Mycobacterium sp.]HME46571.1 NAD(P)/FAD-dependent oxidoreductase [Mycobacterium sp.]
MRLTDAKTANHNGVRHVKTLIIGSGFSGLGAGIRLTQEGQHDFLVLERGEDVGGTWRDNTYPGAACDVPSHLYSYSFALNPGWSRSFSKQSEIQEYIRGIARKYKVLDKHVFGCDVHSAHWDAEHARWEVQTSQGKFTATIVVSAIGVLCEPALPKIKGIDSFEGEVFHSARWNHDADLTGKRVAVIGTGASAIQIVPAIADEVGRLDIYQRTAPWLIPRLDRRYMAAERFAFRYLPGFQRLSRTGIYWGRETLVVGLAKARIFMKPVELAARAKLRFEVKDPEVRAKATPDFKIGCKRILMSNDYYPALNRDNVDLVTDGIAEVRPNAIVARDGTVREVDAIVVATGFQVTDSPTYDTFFGKDGRSLAAGFGERGQQAYKGSAIANFPNMFFLLGPNTGLGHTSVVHMIESQINYLAGALATFDKQGLRTLEVRKDAQDAYNKELQHKLSKTVWMTGGCASWYLDKHGNNPTLWPGFTFEFRRLLRNFDVAAYDTTAAVHTEADICEIPTDTAKVAAN